MTTKPIRPDDRRVQRTKGLLGNAIIELVLERDYDTITIQDIADRADVGRATFYMHYADKQALLLDALNGEYQALAEQLGMARDDPSRPIPMRLLFEHVGQRAAVYRVLLYGIGKTEVYLHTRDMIARYVTMQLGRLRAQADVPMEVVAVHIAGAMLNLLSWWLAAGQPYPPEEMERIGQRLIGDGVAKTLGREGENRPIM